MGRTEQSGEFDAILAGDGFDSRWLLDLTLSGGGVVHLSDAPITLDGVVYQVEIADPPEVSFSQGAISDGSRWPMTLQNADGAYSATDVAGISPLEGAEFVLRYAVSRVGSNAWEVDFICDGILRNVVANAQTAEFGLLHRMYDPANKMSGESITLEELSPVAGLVGNLTGGQGGTGRLTNGWRRDPYLNIEGDERLEREWRPSF